MDGRIRFRARARTGTREWADRIWAASGGAGAGAGQLQRRGRIGPAWHRHAVPALGLWSARNEVLSRGYVEVRLRRRRARRGGVDGTTCVQVQCAAGVDGVREGVRRKREDGKTGKQESRKSRSQAENVFLVRSSL